MPAATRSKRAASPPAADADQAPARKTRAKANAKTDSADNGQANGKTATATTDVKKRAPKNSEAKVKSEPSQDQETDAPALDDKKSEAKPDIKEAQVARAGTSQIPLDEECFLTGYHVYIDPDDGLIYDASLNQTNASGNNNKFYRVQVSRDPKTCFQEQPLTVCRSCSRVGLTTRHGLAGAASAREASMPCSEAAVLTML